MQFTFAHHKVYIGAAVLVIATLVLSFFMALAVFHITSSRAAAQHTAQPTAALASPVRMSEDAVASADVRIQP